MSEQLKKLIGSTPAAIIIAALVVSASVLFAFSHGLGPARTVTETITTTSTTQPSSIQLHKVTFNESGECGGAYIDRWAVTLGNVTIRQPSNATLTVSGIKGIEVTAAPVYKLISKIIFTVPDGTYQYDVTSLAPMAPYKGTVSVNGSDVVIQLEGPEISCAYTG